MLHPEYHTCDKCGKVIKKYGVFASHYNIKNYTPTALVSPTESGISKICHEAAEKETDDISHNIEITLQVSVFEGIKEYELCKRCSRTLKDMIERYIKE